MNSKAESHLSDPAKEHLISDAATITIRNTRNIRNIRNIARVPLGFIDLNAAAPRGCAGAGGCAFFLIHEAHIPPPQERGHDSARGVPCGNETGTNGAKILSVRYFL